MAKVELDNVSLHFKVRSTGRVGLKEFCIRQLFRRSRNPVREIHALREVSLQLHEGDRIGIIGHNGAGKSTLLKLLAGIYPPTSGSRLVEGRISSLFEIALGFEPEANGWENIAYRGYLQGETPQSIQSKVQSIAEFSELGDFLNMPVRYYSAGMMVRLAFSIATAIEPQILLVDEVLGVGDLAFQNKARQRMRDMIAKAQLIVLVSHDLVTLAKLCDKAIWLDHGRIRQMGPVQDVIRAYTLHVQSKPVLPAGDSVNKTIATGIGKANLRGRLLRSNSDAQRSIWRVPNLPPGYYDIQATWLADAELATNAPYHIFDGAEKITTVQVNQQKTPNGMTVKGVTYQSLGVFRLKQGNVLVQLVSEAKNQIVHADSIRVVQVGQRSEIVDNGQLGYEQVGVNWINGIGWGGYGNTISAAPPGDGSQTATWQVEALSPGDYEVFITWYPSPNRATNSPFRVFDGPHQLATIAINQKLGPDGFEYQGVVFQKLGDFPIKSGVLRVVLSNNADNHVVADAVLVRSKPTREPVLVPFDPSNLEGSTLLRAA